MTGLIILIFATPDGRSAFTAGRTIDASTKPASSAAEPVIKSHHSMRSWLVIRQWLVHESRRPRAVRVAPRLSESAPTAMPARTSRGSGHSARTVGGKRAPVACASRVAYSASTAYRHLFHSARSVAARFRNRTVNIATTVGGNRWDDTGACPAV
jgi:hypothetical protein